MNTVPSDLQIASVANKLPIADVAAKIGIESAGLIPYGHDKAKITYDSLESVADRTNGKLILVTAISPTPAGEGKTTTTVGLSDALCALGKNAITCIREPSLGPCFGMKGGAAGGGYAQVVPMTDINLHFTGDLHAIGAAHNLLAALIDNHIHWSNSLNIDPRRVSWGRVLDMNDRALRTITTGLGGYHNGVVREAGFDITVASEIMAIFCLATSLDDLKRRIGNITVAQTRDRQPVLAKQLKAHGALTALLQDAFQPNLVQTLENNPAIMHGGPFANIAHGCNSLIATQTALRLGDFVITEAGFGADLGAEKFLNIKCRKGNLEPDAIVLVATVKALKMHGGVSRDALEAEDVDAAVKGCANLGRHIDNLLKTGIPVTVTINQYSADTDAELAAIDDYCRYRNVSCSVSSHWRDGGRGAVPLAEEIIRLTNVRHSSYQPLYDDELPLRQKAERIAQSIYGAEDVSTEKPVATQFDEFQSAGFGSYPLCMAKTPYSFSTDPQRLGAPDGHTVNIRELRLATGAEFLVAVCGSIMTMPGLPRVPAAESIDVDAQGRITGLF